MYKIKNDTCNSFLLRNNFIPFLKVNTVATSKRISSLSNNLVRAFVKHCVKELNTNRQWACPRKRKLRPQLHSAARLE